MSVDDTSDTLRILGPGKTEIVIGLTDDRTRLFIGVQGRRGEIACANAVKKEAKRIVDRMADMHYLMRGEP